MTRLHLEHLLKIKMITKIYGSVVIHFAVYAMYVQDKYRNIICVNNLSKMEDGCAGTKLRID